MEISLQSKHLGHWIKVLDHSATIWSNRLLDPYGLTRSSWYIIHHINLTGGILQKDLQNALGIESGSMAILVDGLVKKGWLQRKSVKTDRRTKRLEFSSEGEKRWKDVPNFIQILREKMMKGISEEDVAHGDSGLPRQGQVRRYLRPRAVGLPGLRRMADAGDRKSVV